jgi:flagellar biosynthesis protein FlhF
MQRHPAQARLTQKMLDCGFSPALIRKLAAGLGADIEDESAWAASVLERNLLTGDAEPALEDRGGVYAWSAPPASARRRRPPRSRRPSRPSTAP